MIRLDRVPATIALTERLGALPQLDFALADANVTANWNGRGGTLVRARLPFEPIAGPNAHFAPTAIAVTLGDVALPRTGQTLAQRADAHFALNDSTIEVALPRGADPASLRVHNRQAQKRLHRLSVARSGLTPEAFVRYTLTDDDRTRRGLLLPSGSSMRWEVTLPKRARFVTTAVLVPTHIQDTRSDGARFELVVTDATGEHVAGGLDLKPATVFGVRIANSAEQAWSVDLSAWSGKQVSLTLRSIALLDPEWDDLLALAPMVLGAPKAPPRHVVVIGMDTTRADHFGVYGSTLGATDALDAWVHANATVFDAAWAPAPRTRPSFRTATTGRLPLDAVGARNIGDVFADNGFATAGFVTNIHLNPRFDFDVGFDEWLLRNDANATDQVDAALAWQRAHADEDTYLFLHVMDPHLAYAPPKAYAARFLKQLDPTLPPHFDRWSAGTWAATGELTPLRRAHVEGLYNAEVAYTADELARFLNELPVIGDNTLVVVHSDHGEELWDHGGFEHNHTLYQESTRAVLWIKPPPGRSGSGARSAEPVWLGDIAPTLYDYAGLRDTPPTDGRSLAPLLDGAAGGWDRALPQGYLMYDTERWGVIYQGHKYILQTQTGREELYDLAADPGEHHDIGATSDLEPYWRALGEAHHMPVGRGWRVDVTLGSDVVVIVLPSPCEAAGVIDPEAAREHRANFAWGERPPISPEDVATVERSEDGLRLTVRRGSSGQGTLWVRFADEVPELFAIEDAHGKRLGATRPGQRRLQLRGDVLRVRPGVVLDPPPTEASRVRAREETTDEETCTLCALGYLSGPACDGC